MTGDEDDKFNKDTRGWYIANVAAIFGLIIIVVVYYMARVVR